MKVFFKTEELSSFYGTELGWFEDENGNQIGESFQIGREDYVAETYVPSPDVIDVITDIKAEKPYVEFGKEIVSPGREFSDVWLTPILVLPEGWEYAGSS